MATYYGTGRADRYAGPRNEANFISGGPGGDDTLTGGVLSDTIVGGTGADLLTAGDGDDRVTTYDIAANPTPAARNTVDLGAGDDLVFCAGEIDVIDGGAGVDFVSYAGAVGAVGVNLGTGRGLSGEARGDTYTGVEGGVGSGFNDTLVGSAVDNELQGREGDDRLFGGEGVDELAGGEGADRIDGGVGFDFVLFDLATAGVSVDLGTGRGLAGEALGDVYLNVEGAGGSEFNDRLVGDAEGNRLIGRAGDDALDGGAGGDVLEGGDGFDVVNFGSAGAAVSVDLGTGLGFAGEAQGDTYAGIEGAVGSAFDDTLVGGAAGGQLYGLAGDDRLLGGEGHDTLFGNAGADSMDGGAGVDFVSYEAADAAVRVDLGRGRGFSGEARGDAYAGVEVVVGSGFDDVLVGGTADDQLLGNAGADTLTGGVGADVLSGFLGEDRFVFRTVRESTLNAARRDLVLDFEGGIDKLDLAGVDANANAAGDQAFAFVGESAFSGAAGELRFQRSRGDTFVYGDVNGDGRAEFSVLLNGLYALTADDFAL